MRNKFNITIDTMAFEKGYFAFCAELYGPKGEGATPEEAEASLVRSIKQFLQQKRDEGIAEAGPGATVATVTIDEARQAAALRFDEDLIIERARQILEAREKEAAGATPPWKGKLHNEFAAIIEYYNEDGEQGYLARCPAVGGLGSGDTVAEALDDLAEASALMILVQREGRIRSTFPETIHKTISLAIRESTPVA